MREYPQQQGLFQCFMQQNRQRIASIRYLYSSRKRKCGGVRASKDGASGVQAGARDRLDCESVAEAFGAISSST